MAEAVGEGRAEPAARPRVRLTEGWTRIGPHFVRTVECEGPDAALKLARRLVARAQKAGTGLLLGFEGGGLTVGLPADGHRFHEAARGLARSLGGAPEDGAA